MADGRCTDHDHLLVLIVSVTESTPPFPKKISLKYCILSEHDEKYGCGFVPVAEDQHFSAFCFSADYEIMLHWRLSKIIIALDKAACFYSGMKGSIGSFLNPHLRKLGVLQANTKLNVQIKEENNVTEGSVSV